MIRSMTGYGRGEISEDNIEIIAEIRSLNNRFLDLSFRWPKEYSQAEQGIRDLVKKHIVRGRVNINITIKLGNGAQESRYEFNDELVRHYREQLELAQKKLNLNDEITLPVLLSLPEVWKTTETTTPIDDICKLMNVAVEAALLDLCEMRQKEGDELAKDLTNRVTFICDTIQEIEEKAVLRIPAEKERLQERIEKLVPKESVDEGRLEMEIAILADRLDITEECIRFHSHNKLFFDTIKNEKAGGRRLNFVVQEMNREANTIGAKANDADIARMVIEIKEELEKIREQVQNIE